MSLASIHGSYLVKVVHFVIEISYVIQYLQFRRILWLLSMKEIMISQQRLLLMAIIKPIAFRINIEQKKNLIDRLIDRAESSFFFPSLREILANINLIIILHFNIPIRKQYNTKRMKLSFSSFFPVM